MLSLNLVVNFTQTSSLIHMQHKLVSALGDPPFDVVSCSRVNLAQVSIMEQTTNNGS
jgi:hypothetical protein